MVLRTLPPGQQMAMRPTLDLQTSSATSHYSAKLGRCFVELRFVTLEPWSISVKLLDAFESRSVGTFIHLTSPDTRPFSCGVDDPDGKVRSCSDERTFHDLAKIYMDD